MIKEYFKSSFVKNSSYLVLSTIGMQLIAVSTIPILTRFFSPEVFGYHATYRSVLVILGVLLSLKLETAVILPKSNLFKNYTYLATLTNIVVISILISLIYFIFFLFGYDLLNVIFERSGIEIFLLVFFGSISVALSNASQNMLVSFEDFKNISFSKLILPISFFVISILLFYTYNNSFSLVLAHLISYIFLNIFLKSKFKIEWNYYSRRAYFYVLKKYENIVLYTSSNSLINTISSNIPALLLVGFYGSTSLGLYAVGAKIISIPSQLVSVSLSQIFYKKFTDLFNKDSKMLYPFVKKVYIRLIVFGLGAFTLIYLLIPYVIPLLLGQEWIEAVPIIKYLCFWQALVIANSPMSTLTILLNKQKGLLLYQSLLMIARFFALLIPFILDLSFATAIIAYAVVGVFFNLILLVFLLNIARATLKL